MGRCAFGLEYPWAYALYIDIMLNIALDWTMLALNWRCCCISHYIMLNDACARHFRPRLFGPRLGCSPAWNLVEIRFIIIIVSITITIIITYYLLFTVYYVCRYTMYYLCIKTDVACCWRTVLKPVRDTTNWSLKVFGRCQSSLCSWLALNIMITFTTTIIITIIIITSANDSMFFTV